MQYSCYSCVFMFFFVFLDRIIFIFEVSAVISLVHDIVMRVSKYRKVIFKQCDWLNSCLLYLLIKEKFTDTKLHLFPLIYRYLEKELSQPALTSLTLLLVIVRQYYYYDSTNNFSNNRNVLFPYSWAKEQLSRSVCKQFLFVFWKKNNLFQSSSKWFIYWLVLC